MGHGEAEAMDGLYHLPRAVAAVPITYNTAGISGGLAEIVCAAIGFDCD